MFDTVFVQNVGCSFVLVDMDVVEVCFSSDPHEPRCSSSFTALQALPTFAARGWPTPAGLSAGADAGDVVEQLKMRVAALSGWLQPCRLKSDQVSRHDNSLTTSVKNNFFIFFSDILQ